MTLTEAAFWTKRFGVIAIGAFVIFMIVILIVTIEPEQEMPQQYLTANFACTQTKEEFLKYKLEIPSLNLAEGSEMLFELTTETGKIDSLPQIINVYKFNNPTQSVNAQGDAKTLAQKLAFEPDNVIRRAATSYVWIDRESGRSLEVQAKNLNFNMKTDESIIREAAQAAKLPTEQEAKTKALTVLRSLGLGLLTNDYSNGAPRTTFIRVNPDGSFSKARSASDAQLIRVDFVRNKSMITIPSNIVGAESMVQTLSKRMPEQPIIETDIINDKRISIYTFNTLVSFTETQKANISVYIGATNPNAKSSSMNNVYQIDFVSWPINPEACGTYELIPPEVAIEKVQAGEGSLAYLFENDGDDVVEYTPKKVKKFSIMSINITYYESRDELQFLQPVYVISGEVIFDNGRKGSFDYYYPAINYDIVQDKIELPAPEIEEESSFM